jgi:hypothetical protein
MAAIVAPTPVRRRHGPPRPVTSPNPPPTLPSKPAVANPLARLPRRTARGSPPGRCARRRSRGAAGLIAAGGTRMPVSGTRGVSAPFATRRLHSTSTSRRRRAPPPRRTRTRAPTRAATTAAPAPETPLDFPTGRIADRGRQARPCPRHPDRVPCPPAGARASNSPRMASCGACGRTTHGDPTIHSSFVSNGPASSRRGIQLVVLLPGWQGPGRSK